MKDICTECPDFPKIPEICVKMIRRVNDEEGGIKKLVMEVFQAMWFSPVRDKPTLDFNALMRKVPTFLSLSLFLRISPLQRKPFNNSSLHLNYSGHEHYRCGSRLQRYRIRLARAAFTTDVSTKRGQRRRR